MSTQSQQIISPEEPLSEQTLARLDEAAAVLRKGGVIVCPTEGIYGLSAMAVNKEAIERIIAIKKRNESKGLIVVISDMEMLNAVADIDALEPGARVMAEQLWPGHVTIVLPVKAGINPLITGEHDTVAVRLTAFPLLRELCRRAGGAIVSTSANISGQSPLSTVEELHDAFDDLVDYVLEEPCQGRNRPSLVIEGRSGNILRS